MSEVNYQELYEQLKKENEELKEKADKPAAKSPKELYEKLKATGKLRR
jgi:hypothetical protein